MFQSSLNLIRRFSSKKSNVTRYLKRQLTDEFAVKAREHSYRARSAFKLLEIDEKFKILKPGSTVLDIGCAPGSWSQVVVEKCGLNQPGSNGFLLGVDLQVVLPIPGAEILSLSDVTKPSVQTKIQKLLNGRTVDIVFSDMAPNPTGDSATDHLRLIELCRTVFYLFHPCDPSSKAVFPLSSNGIYLCKIWDGAYRKELLMPLKQAVKVALAVGQAVGKALGRAVKEEFKQSQHAATRHSASTGQSASEAKQGATSNAKLGITLEESIQILNVKTPLNVEEVQKNYDHLFTINDKTKGGSFYLQSKIYRAKERVDEEFRRQGIEIDSSKNESGPEKPKSKENEKTD